MDTEKTCTNCGETYPRTTEFFQRQKGRKDGLHTWCKKCKQAYAKQYNPGYYQRNREAIIEKTKAYAEANKEAVRERKKKWHKKNKKKRNASGRRFNRKYRMLAIEAYGSKCECCGENHYEFLAIDHIDGGGRQHRQEIGGNFYRWLNKNDYPEGFRCLCHNCNSALGYYGYCPHQKDS